MKQVTKAEAQKLLVSNKNIVLITGSFDLLHLGHMRFLQDAKNKAGSNAELMIITLNDEQIKRRKGKNRPFFKQNERIEALTYLQSVDYVLGWNEPWEDLRKFVELTQPGVMAVVEDDPGIDNKRQVIEKFGGKILVLKKQGDYSSSRILSEIT